jgi:hypothetical protein
MTGVLSNFKKHGISEACNYADIQEIPLFL